MKTLVHLHMLPEKAQTSLSINSLNASHNFCHLLITYAFSLDPDQDQQNVSPDLDQNCWFCKKMNDQKNGKLPGMQRVKRPHKKQGCLESMNLHMKILVHVPYVTREGSDKPGHLEPSLLAHT